MIFHPLCQLEEIPDGTAKAFCADENGDFVLFVVRRADQVFAYRNRCPHAFRPLEYRRDQFLSADGGAIMCFAHGARFEIETGLCTAGPCRGEYLRRIESRVTGTVVEIEDIAPSGSEERPKPIIST